MTKLSNYPGTIHIKTRVLSIITLLIVLFSSCSDMLEYSESTGYDEKGVFSNSSRATQFVTNIYTYLRSDFQSVGGAMRSSGTDEAEYVWEWSTIHDFTNGSWSSINTVDDVWSHYYAGIRACNLFLEKGANQTFDDYKYTSEYQTMMKQYKNLQWEVRFLRAYFYFELAKRYNEVPLITRVLSPEEAAQVSQNSFQDVVKFIVSECDTVYKYIEPDYKTTGVSVSNETGRISKPAALALKSRALLYAASPLFNPTNDPSKWVEAAKAASQFIDASADLKIKLASSYTAIFNSWTSEELILGRREAESNEFERQNFPIGTEGGNSGNCPSQDLVDAYEMKFLAVSNPGNGRSVFDPLSGYNPADPYKNRDPRLALTVALNNTKWVYNENVQIWEGGKSGLPLKGATKTGYYLKKYVDSSRDLRPDQNTRVRHVWVLFRYAEILLNYAEAMNEAYGPDYTDATFTRPATWGINQVRDRTGVKMKLIPAGLSTDSLRTRIQNERRVEFAFEDQRFWDVRRWKLFGDQAFTTYLRRMRIEADLSVPATPKFTYSTYVDANTPRIWEPKMYFYPIPYNELLKNKNLKQNKDW